ncbi:TetR/AcrR family transcriptional regulator [Chelativorans sp. AA-79]|uniref:TetR/AcrR family transcriptional regulator n=1 Tax=Chelativorans sp. AA-79 TaxID=3028735 RepID=UPI0023F62358|nr:TetR/AcrR family transcriptional regulator [Chelativorans sp. AA-79]WEX08635.1 TetR/AcrR family transcriptional regulator [Chelativorans sp. AA-79]
MPRRRSAGERKAEIVAEVLRLADEIGPDRLSTTDVARAVGITQPAIFRHFGTKHALWLAVAEDIAGQLTAAWDAMEAENHEPEARLRALIGAQLTAISRSPALPSILFSRELQTDNPALREVFRLLLLAFQKRLVSTVAELQADGVLSRDVSAEDVAVLLTSLIQGVAIRWSLGGRAYPLVAEGMRMFDVQMALLRLEKDSSHG